MDVGVRQEHGIIIKFLVTEGVPSAENLSSYLHYLRVTFYCAHECLFEWCAGFSISQ